MGNNSLQQVNSMRKCSRQRCHVPHRGGTGLQTEMKLSQWTWGEPGEYEDNQALVQAAQNGWVLWRFSEYIFTDIFWIFLFFSVKLWMAWPDLTVELALRRQLQPRPSEVPANLKYSDSLKCSFVLCSSGLMLRLLKGACTWLLWQSQSYKAIHLALHIH